MPILGVPLPEDLVLLADKLVLVVVLELLDQGLFEADLWREWRLVGEGLAEGVFLEGDLEFLDLLGDLELRLDA